MQCQTFDKRKTDHVRDSRIVKELVIALLNYTKQQHYHTNTISHSPYTQATPSDGVDIGIYTPKISPK